MNNVRPIVFCPFVNKKIKKPTIPISIANKAIIGISDSANGGESIGIRNAIAIGNTISRKGMNMPRNGDINIKNNMATTIFSMFISNNPPAIPSLPLFRRCY
jgi:hypothetical protein